MKGSEGFVVLVEFKVKAGQTREFLELITRHAEASFANETGCLQFDVIEDGSDPERVILYEVYADEAAFHAHRAMPQVASTLTTIEPLIESSKVTTHNRFRHPRATAGAAKRVFVAPEALRERQYLLKGLEQAGFELVFPPEGEQSLDEPRLIGLLGGCSAAIAGLESYNHRVLAQSPDLRCIVRLGAGHETIDVAAATTAGVAVAVAAGMNQDAVADYVLTCMGMLVHRTRLYDTDVRAGKWRPLFHGSLSGLRVGLVGFGRIGRAIAKRCQGFSMDVLVADPQMDAEGVGRLGCTLTTLEQMLPAVDVLSIQAPLLPTTRDLIDAHRLAMMKPGAFLINVARGALIDEQALVSALRSGHLAGAALDVFTTMPLPRNSPLLEAPNLILTPHVAGLSEPALEHMARRAAHAIVEALSGNDPGPGVLLNPEVLRPTVLA